MDHNVTFPIYVCLDDGRLIRIESFSKILYDLEAVDIENDEYMFWDANGKGMKILIENDQVSGFRSADNKLSLRQAIETYTKQLGTPIDTSGTPTEVWARVQEVERNVPKPRWFVRLLRRC
jgi:hypothetical protein